MKNSAGTLFGRSRGPGHRTAAVSMTSERAASMQPVDEVVVPLGRAVPVIVDETVVRAGADPVPAFRCGLVPKIGTVPLKTYISC